ncbi:probable rRNA-processing protein EBP2 homolog [Portunus trituberculatus]|uniref:probable rRNA-processing protein EBP2 homolog n=1 Tax=Portunus trituberculatus TaxID=210409 RepID=UPI001E1D0E15|nr:probable rRNA-processing protein EBP2 homolog [Portunus trituberculatus]
MVAIADSDSEEMEFSDIVEMEEAEEDSDEELQRKFERGELKPGLYREAEKVVKEHKNNVSGLKSKLEQFRLELPWIERLDFTLEAAPIAPELNAEIIEHGQTREKRMRSQNKYFTLEDDPVHNDFVREMSFYRQAQSTVLEGYKKLEELNLPTVRPSDYFAEMAKSDEHMQKVRKRLMQKQVGQQISERVKKIREIKKYGKKVQIEVEQQKHKEKREMLEKIKKFRKGKTDSIDFLEGGRSLRDGAGGNRSKKDLKKAAFKRTFKDKKYGFGGKKRNIKRNNIKDTKDERPLPNMRKPRGGKGGRGGNKKGPMGANVRGKGGKRGGTRGMVNKNKGRSRK